MSLEQRLFDTLSEITGSSMEKVSAVASAPVVAPTATDKLASMPLSEVLTHPDFVRGFETRVGERMGDLDAAVAMYLENV